MVSLSKLTFLGAYVNGALATGAFDHITIEDVREPMEDGRLFDWVERTLSRDEDVSLSPLATFSPGERTELNAELAEMGTAELASHHLRDDSRGLALVVATVLMAISLRADHAVVQLAGHSRHRGAFRRGHEATE